MKILIALVGTSPAVVTETLWALANPNVLPDKRFLPDKLVLITTGEGRTAIEDELLKSSGRVAPLVALAALVGALHLAVEGQGLEIRVPDLPRPTVQGADRGDDNTEPDSDVHSQDELGRMGDLIFSTFHHFTSQPTSQICLSIAGGRKTMSHLAGTVMAMLARPDDFMTHVLVEPSDIERCTDYFYPFFKSADLFIPPAPGSADQTPIKVKQTHENVRLSTVPFLRLRNIKGIANAVSNYAAHGFTVSVARANEQLRSGKQWTLTYRKACGKVYLDQQDIEATQGHDGGSSLTSVCMQIALLRAFAQPSGLPLILDEDEDFRKFMQYWFETKVRKEFSEPSWRLAYAKAFEEDVEEAKKIAETSNLDLHRYYEHRKFSDRYFKEKLRNTTSDKSRLARAIRMAMGGNDDSVEVFRRTDDTKLKGVRERHTLSPNFVWKEED